MFQTKHATYIVARVQYPADDGLAFDDHRCDGYPDGKYAHTSSAPNTVVESTTLTL